MPSKLSIGGVAALRSELESQASTSDWIKVGLSTCGVAAGAQTVFDTLSSAVADRGIAVEVRKTGCNGSCWAEPLVEVQIAGAPRTMYGGVTPEKALEILEQHVGNKKVLDDLVVPGMAEQGYEDGDLKPTHIQRRVTLRNCGIIDPTSLDDYIRRGGYAALEKALGSLGGEGVIEEVKTSGLRGRGGAGFPTWMKWSFCRKSQADEKFMICNADEGDPGAYMDRSILEGDPHAVVEGMILAGLATASTMGYFYIRAEYPLAIERIELAIRQARRMGLLGKNILGSDFSYDLEIRLGAGAFVCGEETALMHSIEGKRGTPRPRPPFPAQKGLWEKPSNINNVETLANIAPIIANGGAWFAGYGTEKSKGTKVFAVTGKVAKAGLVEIPMGTTLREVVFGIAGGVPDGKSFKAVQTGGPSGGMIPADYLDTPISYESLQELGSIMGSGGMIVMDEDDNMLDVAKFYLDFTVEESCGKCAPCRIGGKQMLELLEKLSSGKGCPEDITSIRTIAKAMQKASLCALGQTAPNPVIAALRYFAQEFDEVIASPAEAAV